MKISFWVSQVGINRFQVIGYSDENSSISENELLNVFWKYHNVAETCNGHSIQYERLNTVINKEMKKIIYSTYEFISGYDIMKFLDQVENLII